MNNYKNSYLFALAGLGLGFVFVKFLSKNKNLPLGKTVLISGALGGALGLGIDLMKRQENDKPKVTEQSLIDLAKSISPDAEKELSNYLFLLKKADLPAKENQKAYNVLNGFLLAKKDNKWDSNLDIQGMKKTLLSYGVTEDDFQVFQSLLANSIFNTISSIFQKKTT
jgi:hypothetical protein